jgi:transcriptional regulator with XRE-family HTH domain
MDDLSHGHRRTVRDYRLALGLAITHMRESADCSVKQISARTGIPEQTLRSYEHGDSQPPLPRLLQVERVLSASAFDLLIDTSKYIYRTRGRPFPEPDSACRAKLSAILLYCGASLDDIDEMLNHENF